MALDQYRTQVLLLHSEQSTLDTLSTGFSDKYSVHTATSGSEALNVFSETPVHVIVSAQKLPGMSGLDALREARKRSPETIGILLAGSDENDGLEALVGEKEVFQIVRGEISPEALRTIIDNATQRARLLAISRSANDTSANVDQPAGEHIVMETSENGSAIISDGTGTIPVLKPQKISVSAGAGSRAVDVLVLTRDEEFLETIKDSARGLHTVHHSLTPTQAEEVVSKHKVGVLVTDAAMVGSNIEGLTQRLRQHTPRLVAVVAGRRDDGELLMDLINRGQVYRFLLKPVSPGRARLAIEASVKHHLEAADKAFKPSGKSPPPAKAAPAKAPPPVAAKPVAKPPPTARPAPKPKATVPTKSAPPPTSGRLARPAPPPTRPAPRKPAPIFATRDDALLNDGLGDAFDESNSFTETMTGLAFSVGQKISAAAKARKEPASIRNANAPVPARSVDTDSKGLFGNPKAMSVAAAALVAAIVAGWSMLGSDEPTPQDVVERPAVQADRQPAPAETVTEPRDGDRPAAIAAPAPLALAREARDAGRLVSPPSDNAVEHYVAALAQMPPNANVQAELDSLLEQVVGLAETAMLEQRLGDASIALQMIEMADADNPRLTFLNAQLDQLQLRGAVDAARQSIREGRFEDAATQLNRARAITGADAPEVLALAQELAAARSAQQVGKVLQLANARLDENKLISPSNDNARYFFELALSNDPDNIAARQGLAMVAGKLALRARTAIDAGQLVNAEDLLRSARALDPDSSELADLAAALASARAANAATAANDAVARAGDDADADAASVTDAAGGAADAGDEMTPEAMVGAGDRAAAAIAASTNKAGATPEMADDTTPEGVAREDAASMAQEAELRRAATAEPEMVPVSSLTRINYVAPQYPRAAQRRNVTGYVDVSFTVRRDGSVAGIEVIEGSPGSIFDDAATTAVAEWRFEPTLENGQPVEKRTAVRLAFDLQ